ncbi:MAG: hypothetical protein WBD36_13415 [Bacteroidota bacterium]
MENRARHPRGSSPHQGAEQGLHATVERHRSKRQFRERRGNDGMELVFLHSTPPEHTDDEGRWQDDGGEGG